MLQTGSHYYYVIGLPVLLGLKTDVLGDGDPFRKKRSKINIFESEKRVNPFLIRFLY